jgi:hypothetical protein
VGIALRRRAVASYMRRLQYLQRCQSLSTKNDAEPHGWWASLAHFRRITGKPEITIPSRTAPVTKVPWHFCILISKSPVEAASSPEIPLARHRPSQSSCCSNDPDGAPFQLFTPICPTRAKTPCPRGRALGPESGAGSEVNAEGDMLSVQMHWGKRVGLSSGSSEFQEKMRLGGICRLGSALWILNEFCVLAGISLN